MIQKDKKKHPLFLLEPIPFSFGRFSENKPYKENSYQKEYNQKENVQKET